MYKTITNLFFILVLSSIVFFSGCGKKDETSSGENTGDQKVEEQNTDQTTAQNEQKSTNELGIKEGLPVDYPADVPQPKNSKVLGSLNTSEGTVVTFESTDKPKEIYSQYSEELKKSGYKESDDNQMSDEGGMAMWNKDKKEVNIMLAWDKDKSKSSVVVTYK